MGATVKILWSPEEDAHLLKLKAAGYTNQSIADSVGRPRSTVGNRLSELFKLMPKKQLDAIRTKRLVPKCQAPVLGSHVVVERAPERWTAEIDEKITMLRKGGMSYKRIGLAVGVADKTVYERLWKLHGTDVFDKPEKLSIPKPIAKNVAEIKRPAGPVPEHPESPASPYEPGWRRCLGYDCKRYFWSPSASVRICHNCKNLRTRVDGHGAQSRISDTSEYVLHL